MVWAHNSHVGDARATEMGLRLERAGAAKTVRPALPGSYERVFHDTGSPGSCSSFALATRRPRRSRNRSSSARSAWSIALPPSAVMHFDETRAVEPLERTAEWVKGELPETYPFAV